MTAMTMEFDGVRELSLDEIDAVAGGQDASSGEPMTEAQCGAMTAQLGIASGISTMMVGIGVGFLFGSIPGAIAGGLTAVVTGGATAGASIACNAGAQG